MSVIILSVYCTVIITTVFVQYGSSVAWSGDKRCCIKCPRAMNINTFNSQVATGEDWVEYWFYVCPADPSFGVFEQFRSSFNVSNGVLTRVVNYRPGHGEPCIGASSNLFDQVGTKRAVFKHTVPGGLIEEIRFLDTGALDDYYIQFTCSDRGGARRGWCFSYYVALVIRHDPPSNFPWDKAVYDLKRLGIKARDFISVYVDEVCPV